MVVRSALDAASVIPLSDFTARRIADALSERPAGVWTIAERRWLA